VSVRGEAKRKVRKKKPERRDRILPSVTVDPAVESPALKEEEAPRARSAPPRPRISIRRPPTRHVASLAGALLVAVAVLYVSFVPVAGLPALRPAFTPTTRAWPRAADAQAPDRMLPL